MLKFTFFCTINFAVIMIISHQGVKIRPCFSLYYVRWSSWVGGWALMKGSRGLVIEGG